MESKVVAIIKKAQEILAAYIVPDSGISDHECINQLLGLLDGPECRDALAAAPSQPAADQLSTEPHAYLVTYREIDIYGGKKCVTFASLEPLPPALATDENVESRELMNAEPLFARATDQPNAAPGSQPEAQGDTPETEAEAFWIKRGENREQFQGCEYVRAGVSRRIERKLTAALRERDEARHAMKRMKAHGTEVPPAIAERFRDLLYESEVAIKRAALDDPRLTGAIARAAREELKERCTKRLAEILSQETMSKHASQGSCMAARESIQKCFEAIRALPADE